MKRKLTYYTKHWDKYLKKVLLKFRPSNKPDFIIAGAQKAATTSLFNYLNQFPEMHGSLNKEVHYFDMKSNYGKSLNWYHSNFKSFRKTVNTLYFESTPSYLYIPGVIEKIYKYNPNIKLIILLRNPIDRAFSAWNMYVNFFVRKEDFRFKNGLTPEQPDYIHEAFFKNRSEPPTFRECLDIELNTMKHNPNQIEPSLIRRGYYYEQLHKIFQIFQKKNIYVLGYNDFINHPEESVSNILDFLNYKGIRNTTLKTSIRNANKYKSSMEEQDKETLEKIFIEQNKKLFQLVGSEINW